MKMIITDTPELVGNLLADRIVSEIERNVPVLFLASGGSTAPVAASVCKTLSRHFAGNRNTLKWLLTVSLVDERFGPIHHADSNWQVLVENGFNPAEMTAIPVLRRETATEDDLADAVTHYNAFLTEATDRHDKGDVVIIALFGIGKGGFTAGILPQSPVAKMSVDSADLAASYKSALFTRITVTPAFFRHIDYAVAWAAGEEKKPELAALHAEAAYEDQPAQLLKHIKECVVLTDQDGNPGPQNGVPGQLR